MMRILTLIDVTFSSGLYCITIKLIESYVVMNQKFNDLKVFVIWHDRLGHLASSMMHQMIEHSHGHPLKKPEDFFAQ